MIVKLFTVAWNFYWLFQIGWIGAKDISGSWTWTEPVNAPLAYEPAWSPADPNGGDSLCMLFLYEWFGDEPCTASFAVGVFCEHYDIPLFIKHSDTM